MQLPGSRQQNVRDHQYRADGTITTGGTSQLLLPERKSCSYLYFQNNSNDIMWLEIGGAYATAAIANAGVSAVTVVNGGFGYVAIPKVFAYGGGNGGNGSFNGVGLLGYPAPGDIGFAAPRTADLFRPAKLRAVLTGGIVTSIVVDDPGSGYVAAPQIFIENELPLDPFGVADPDFGGTKSGMQFGAGGSFAWNNTHCPTGALAVWGPNTGDAFTCRWAP